MGRLIKKIIDVREGESRRLVVMMAYNFLIISAHNILKPMTRSLFVSNMGLEQLPFLYILLAGVVGVFITFYLKISAGMQLGRLINITTLFLMSNLVLFWWLLNSDIRSPLLYYSLFIWGSIFGVLAPTQFWLLANMLFNAREAKRLFPVLTTSAILGGIMGGYLTGFFVTVIGGTPNLALFCLALLGGTMLLINMAWRYRSQTEKQPAASRAGEEPKQFLKIISEVFLLIRNSRQLGLMIGIVGITFMVVQIADFQFTAYGSETSDATDDLTGFLGFWLSNMSVIALLFQIFFSGAIIRRFGVGVTILFLPAALMITSLGVFLSYGLVSILALKIGDGAFRHSINKVGTELLYLPIPDNVKRKTKAFVDMFIDRLARGLAGGTLLVFYSYLGMTVAQISLISVILIVIWLMLSFAAYREYVNSFRTALAKRQIDTDLISVSIRDQTTINSLIVTLGSRNERQIIYALQLLDSVEGVDLEAPLLPLLKHQNPEIRLKTIKLLQKQGDEDLVPHVQPLLRDKDVDTRRAAVRFCARFSGQDKKMLTQWLTDENTGLRGAALFYLTENPDLGQEMLTPDLIESFMTSGKEARMEIADVLGALPADHFKTDLRTLLGDPDPEIKTRAIQSAGRRRDPEFVPQLVQFLQDKTFRKTARQALADHGSEILDQLHRYLRDPSVPAEIRKDIPRIFALIDIQESVEILLQNLSEQDEVVRYQVLKALNKLRVRSPELRFDNRVDEALTEELKRYHKMLATLHITCDRDPKVNFTLLRRALQERLDDHANRIFRLLGLRYPPRDIYNAYAATLSSFSTVRADAVEFLDNILAPNLKRIIVPIVEKLPAEQILQRVNGMGAVTFSDRKQAIRQMMTDGDPWLKTCTLYEVGINGFVGDFRDLVYRAKEDENQLVSETATVVLDKFDSGLDRDTENTESLDSDEII